MFTFKSPPPLAIERLVQMIPNGKQQKHIVSLLVGVACPGRFAHLPLGRVALKDSGQSSCGAPERPRHGAVSITHGSSCFPGGRLNPDPVWQVGKAGSPRATAVETRGCYDRSSLLFTGSLTRPRRPRRFTSCLGLNWNILFRLEAAWSFDEASLCGAAVTWVQVNCYLSRITS